MQTNFQHLLGMCLFLFSGIYAQAQSCDGGSVSTAAGDTIAYTCPGDGIADLLSFAHVTPSTDNYAYVVTDDQGNILGLPPGNTVNFEGAGTGNCLVWGLSYTGTLLVSIGDNALTSTVSSGCFDLSDNFVTVVRDMPDGGTVSTAAGDTTAYTCPGDGIADMISFAHVTPSNSQFRYVVTDDQGTILGLPPGNTVDFEGAGVGNCLVWGLSYTGNILVSMGDNALTSALTDECFDLSDNFVTVVRDMPDGGTVSTAAGDTTAYTCPGDGIADMISFAHVTPSNSQFRYVVTDDQGTILGLPPGNTVNFEGAGVGNCLVWGLSYTGNILVSMGDNALTSALTDECFDLSDNFVTVVRDMPDGGTVSTAAGDTTAYTCPGDGIADMISFAHVTPSNSQFRYVVTDDQGTILGLPPGNTVNFEGAGVGNCLVWGLSYTGNILVSMGDNALTSALTDECFDLSDNFVTVVRDMPDGGTVSTAAGDTTAYTCPGDGIADMISFAHVTPSNSQFRYVVTDDQGTILGLPPGNTVNFEGAGVGNCLVWGLSYTGNILVSMGDNALTSALTDECFDLSDNFVTVVRDMPDGGTVSTAAGDTTAYTCPGDGIADMISFAHVTPSNSQFRYVVTDDQGTILGLPPGNTVNFEGAGVGNCLVWGLSYTGNILVSMGDNALTSALTDECFDLSDNFVTVVRDMPDGGTVSTAAGDTTAYTCPGDGIADMISFAHVTPSNSQFRYVVTDDQGTILGLPPGNTVNFEGAGVGNCLVWGLSYTGNILVSMGDNALTSALTDECFDLSDNFVTVVRDMPDGGLVATVYGETEVYTCAGDGMADKIMFDHVTNSNSQYCYVVTDLNGTILGLPPGNMVDFEGAGTGTCLVWGLSYTGNILVGMGDNALTSAITDECFDLSDNSIKVIRNNNCVTDFTLVNAKTDTDIGPIMDGDVIDLKVLGTNDLTLRANVTGNDIESVRFWFNGNSNHQLENNAPYAFNGDNNNGDYYPYQFTPGTYSVMATPYSQNGGQGTKGTPKMITFTVISTPDSVTSFILVDATTNQDIGPLVDGDVLDLNVLGTDQLSIRAMTNPYPVGSVLFGLNGNTKFQTENNLPYALKGDNNGNYKSVTFSPGSYTVTATPYSQRARRGDAGVALTVNFTVVGAASSGSLAFTPVLETFPNPTTAGLTVDLSSVNEGAVEVTVVNLMGSVVYQARESVIAGPWRGEVALDQYPAGVYMLTVRNGNFHETKRVIKE